MLHWIRLHGLQSLYCFFVYTHQFFVKLIKKHQPKVLAGRNIAIDFSEGTARKVLSAEQHGLKVISITMCVQPDFLVIDGMG